MMICKYLQFIFISLHVCLYGKTIYFIEADGVA